MVAGMQAATYATGIRYKGRDDAFLASFDAGTTVAGVLTRSVSSAAPIDWCRSKLKGGKIRALLVNAGNANAFTGKAGVAFVHASVAAAAKAVGCKKDEVFVASTGVIGQPLPAGALAAHVPTLAAKLGSASMMQLSSAFMTTDTFAKGAVRTITLDKKTVTLVGVCKGSGMIAPDMATMIGFVFTDAAIAAPALQKMLTVATNQSFNCLTVDGDTSTNDTLLVAATGKAGNKPIKSTTDKNAQLFQKALTSLCIELAQLIARDGEGAQKLITINLKGAVSDASARKIALTVANSPLVKTAIAGEDANWGRIVAAIGRSGEKAVRDKIKVAIGGTLIAARGMAVTGYDETPVVNHIKGREVVIDLDLGIGKGKATVWTCDLTHGYIDINGSYRS